MFFLLILLREPLSFIIMPKCASDGIDHVPIEFYDRQLRKPSVEFTQDRRDKREAKKTQAAREASISETTAGTHHTCITV